MRAVWYKETGPAPRVLQVGSLDDPEPGAGEVLVRLYASGVNPSDTKRRAGWLGAELGYPFVIPHSDGAGVIEAVGAGVPSERLGGRVWVYGARHARALGTAAEYVALPADQAVPLPDDVSFAEGACLGVPAFTAHCAVFSDGPVTGQVLLVAGGAGAVGHYAIQFAKGGGATVLTTVSSKEKAEHARRGGADCVLNYLEGDVVDRVLDLTGRKGVDRIVEVDFGTNVTLDTAVIKPNGVIASYSSTRVPEPRFPYYPLAFKGVTLRLVQASMLPPEARRQGLEDITHALLTGQLRHTVARRFPLEETSRAHEALEAGRLIGKAVVEIA